ncbi:MAG: EAL domain-containing protein [Pseudomonadota bacterium]
MFTDPSFRDPLLPLEISDTVAQRQRQVLDKVEAALARDDAFLLFQPVFDSRRPDRVAFYEGLIRIRDETGQTIPAGHFMDLCDAHPLGREIDCTAIRLGLRALQERPDVRLSINMSARSIGHAAWLDAFQDGIGGDPTVCDRLILEITESSAMETPDVTAIFMEQLQAYGVSFALDDFGAGCTSLRQFRDFRFDILKIDKFFIRDLDKDPDNRAIVSSLLSLARHFDLLTVAEGVETAGESLAASDLGIDCLQGYLHGMPAELPDEGSQGTGRLLKAASGGY